MHLSPLSDPTWSKQLASHTDGVHLATVPSPPAVLAPVFTTTVAHAPVRVCEKKSQNGVSQVCGFNASANRTIYDNQGNKQEKGVIMPSAVFDHMLKSFERYSLTSSDIETIARTVMGIPAKVVIYEQLAKSLSLSELFSNGIKGVVLFYPTDSQTSGHWTLLLKHTSQPEYEFFDSYGLKYDDEIQYAPYLQKNKPVNQSGVPWLTHLIQLERPNNVVYNTVRLQGDFEQVSTCGAHVLIRLLHHDKSLRYYQSLYGHNYKIAYKGLSADDLVVIQLMSYLLPHHHNIFSGGNLS